MVAAATTARGLISQPIITGRAHTAGKGQCRGSRAAQCPGLQPGRGAWEEEKGEQLLLPERAAEAQLRCLLQAGQRARWALPLLGASCSTLSVHLERQSAH